VLNGQIIHFSVRRFGRQPASASCSADGTSIIPAKRIDAS